MKGEKMSETKKLPQKGLGHYEIQDRLIAFERASHFATFERNLFDEGPHLTSSPSLPWGDAIRERVVQAWVRFMHGEIWHTGVGARQMEREVISMMGAMFGNPEAVGFITSGGSESDICALIAAKGRAFCKRYPEVDRSKIESTYDVVFRIPEFEKESRSIVMPYHSHYSLYKGCAMLGLEAIPVSPIEGTYYKINPDDIRAAIREDTIGIVGTAATWPFGTIDPIEEMGKIAEEYDLYFHVDACFGGFIIPFLERSGYYDPPLAPWDFRVPSVCSISADLHKNGMVPPPASSLYFRNAGMKNYARLFAPPFGAVSGTRATGPIAASWTMLMSLGIEGYTAISRHTIRLQEQLNKAISKIPGLKVLPDSKINLSVIYSEKYDLRPVVKALAEQEWCVSSHDVPPPVGICICCMPQNDGQIDAFVAVLEEQLKVHGVPIGSLGEDYEFSLYGLDLD
jgi:glutamate/tyrosine decarboxylase-like PLP-dependent enzyme